MRVGDKVIVTGIRYMKVGDKVIVTNNIPMGSNLRAVPIGTRGIITEISGDGKLPGTNCYIDLFYDVDKISNYEHIWLSSNEFKLDISELRDEQLTKLGIC